MHKGVWVCVSAFLCVLQGVLGLWGVATALRQGGRLSQPLAHTPGFSNPSSTPQATVLVTRSGCDKQRPHNNDDWILLSFDPDTVELEVSRAIQDITSPSFDSWLILGQAATNVGLARKFKVRLRVQRWCFLQEAACKAGREQQQRPPLRPSSTTQHAPSALPPSASKRQAAGRSRKYVDMVEKQGVALCHFHGFVPRKALPPNVAFFGQVRV